jgi:hypothetical protein
MIQNTFRKKKEKKIRAHVDYYNKRHKNQQFDVWFGKNL